ncbi:MAG: hypothetical protein HY762_09455, partial [Planctomycetes bacterium]|nr:hypothetical protein [Planctomycetota bacterium]
VGLSALILVGCFLEGPRGDAGSSGIDGTNGSSGQDAVLATYTYEFTPVGNPYVKVIPAIVLDDVKSGTQTVTSYINWAAGEWVQVPCSLGTLDHLATVGNGFVKLETYSGGVLSGGDAFGGKNCLIVFKIYNK